MLAMGTSAARANGEFDFSVGYAHLTLDGSAGPFDQRDGIRFEPRVSWQVGGDTSPLRLGFGVPFSSFGHDINDNGHVIIIDGNDTFIVDSDSWESVNLVTPEFQASLRLMLGPGDVANKKWFIEPGIAVGVVIGQYWVGNSFGWWSDTAVSEWDATIAGRPFLRAGWQGEHWTFGLEGSYMFGGKLHFTDRIEGDVSEWYGGGFFGVRW
jgi:hypothetical protein